MRCPKLVKGVTISGGTAKRCIILQLITCLSTTYHKYHNLLPCDTYTECHVCKYKDLCMKQYCLLKMKLLLQQRIFRPLPNAFGQTSSAQRSYSIYVVFPAGILFAVGSYRFNNLSCKICQFDSLRFNSENKIVHVSFRQYLLHIKCTIYERVFKLRKD